jgi:hypothetical protein
MVPRIPQDKQQEYERLVELLRGAGAPDPEAWASSEIQNNSAQLARYCFLRSLWPRIIDSWRDEPDWMVHYVTTAENRPRSAFADAGLALKRLQALGASDLDIGRIARAVAYAVVFDLLYHLGYGSDPSLAEQFPEQYPGWALMELGADGELTGRDLDGMHESLLTMDPSGRDGSPEPDE